MKKLLLIGALVGSMSLFTGCIAAPPTNNVQIAEDAVWPTDMPSNVPQLEKGTLAQVVTLATGHLVEYSDVDQAGYDAYVAAVEANGWTLNFSASDVSKSFKNGSSRLDVSLIEGKCLVDYSK